MAVEKQKFQPSMRHGKTQRAVHASDLLRELGLGSAATLSPQLSGGQQQRVSIAGGS